MPFVVDRRRNRLRVLESVLSDCDGGAHLLGETSCYAGPVARALMGRPDPAAVGQPLLPSHPRGFDRNTLWRPHVLDNPPICGSCCFGWKVFCSKRRRRADRDTVLPTKRSRRSKPSDVPQPPPQPLFSLPFFLTFPATKPGRTQTRQPQSSRGSRRRRRRRPRARRRRRPGQPG